MMRLAGAALAVLSVCGMATGQMQRGQARQEQQRGEPPRPPVFQQGDIPRTVARSPRMNGRALADLLNWHADRDTGINSQNVDRLGPAWTYETPDFVTHKPLVHDGRVFFGDWAGNIYALDAESGREIWKKQVEENVKSNWPWHGFAGTGAVGDGVLFEASVEGHAYAIDTESGEVIWSRRIAEDEHAGNVGTLLHHEGIVYVGLASVEEALDLMEEGFEPDFLGRVVAIDAETGDTVWGAQLVQPPSNGVGVWSGFTVDPGTGVLYFTTSNNYTGQASALSDAIIAVDARTGRMLWSDQVTAHDTWTMAEPVGPDYAFAAAPQIFDARINGRNVPLVGAGQKSGVYYAWDRRTGERVWSVVVGYGDVGGGIHADASVGPGRIFVWGNNGYPYANPGEHPMDVAALDAATGEYLWIKSKAQPANLTTAGFLADDVYFVGSLDGVVRGYRASDGEELWTSQDHGPIGGSLVVAEGKLFWSTGVPAAFGGRSEPGGSVVAYGTGGGQAAARLMGAQEQQDARMIEVTAHHMAFEPSTITVAAGETVTIKLVNEGGLGHNIEFDLPGDNTKISSIVFPQESGKATFTAPEAPGRYEFWCPVASHREKGMTGTLVVRPAGGGGDAQQNQQNRNRNEQHQHQGGQQGDQHQDQQGDANTRTLTITAENMDFNPSVITVALGTQLRIKLVNRGSARHSIEFHLAGDKEAELANSIAPGEEDTLTFTAPSKPGEYVFYCPVGNHRELGMEGTLIVKKQN